MKILIKKGIDVNFSGKKPKLLPEKNILSKFVAIDLRHFYPLPLKLLVSEGLSITKGSPLAFYKNFEDIFITSHVSGLVVKIKRGHKRSLEEIVLEVSNDLTPPIRQSFSYNQPQELLYILKKNGLFALIKQMPFDIPALPINNPRDVFINLADNRPLTPSNEDILSVFSSQEEGLSYFFEGVKALNACFQLKPHIVIREESVLNLDEIRSFSQIHTISGPYPSGSKSVHIHHIAPIKSENDIVFTLSFYDVISIGHFLKEGYHLDKQYTIVSETSTLRKVITYKGSDINSIINTSSYSQNNIIVSGDPLTGRLCDPNNCFLGNNEFVVSIISKPKKREFLNFLRIGLKKFTFSKTYLSGFKLFKPKTNSVDNNLHGETRPFIDSEVYDKVIPIKIPFIHLMKAIIAKDIEYAMEIGFLEISKEDLSLPTMIDPSKIEMMKIFREAQLEYVKSNIISPMN